MPPLSHASLSLMLAPATDYEPRLPGQPGTRIPGPGSERECPFGREPFGSLWCTITNPVDRGVRTATWAVPSSGGGLCAEKLTHPLPLPPDVQQLVAGLGSNTEKP